MGKPIDIFENQEQLEECLREWQHGGCVRFHERQTYGNINRSCNLFCREKCGCIPQSVYDIL